jgi:hypothetical protein
MKVEAKLMPTSLGVEQPHREIIRLAVSLTSAARGLNLVCLETRFI